MGKVVAALMGQVLIESLRNRTEPSAKPKLAPPGWRLEAEAVFTEPIISHGPARRKVLQLVHHQVSVRGIGHRSPMVP